MTETAELLDAVERALCEAEAAVESAIYLASHPILSHQDFHAALEAIGAIHRQHGASSWSEEFIQQQLNLVQGVLEPSELWSGHMEIMGEKFKEFFKLASELMKECLKTKPISERAQRLVLKLSEIPVRWKHVIDRVRTTPGMQEMDERVRSWRELERQWSGGFDRNSPPEETTESKSLRKYWWQFWRRARR